MNTEEKALYNLLSPAQKADFLEEQRDWLVSNTNLDPFDVEIMSDEELYRQIDSEFNSGFKGFVNNYISQL